MEGSSAALERGADGDGSGLQAPQGWLDLWKYVRDRG